MNRFLFISGSGNFYFKREKIAARLGAEPRTLRYRQLVPE